MTVDGIEEALAILKKESKHWKVPVVTLVANTGNDPYRVLISCLLSLRTNDATTAPAVQRLFAVADTPQAMVKLNPKQIEQLIYPVGFYRNKAKILIDVSQRILKEHEGKVPDTIEGLLEFNGVGRKTANLVISEGFGKPAICVDVHVHRITNRFGFLRTANPEETEFALRKKLPKRWWRTINQILVAFGQHHCRPVSPHCSQCKVLHLCERRGVTVSR